MRGDGHLYRDFVLASQSGKGFNHLTGQDALYGAIITAAGSVDTADPRWGSGGGTNLSSLQVSTGGGYTGPVLLTNAVATTRWASSAGGILLLKVDDITIPNHASGFTNGATFVIYNDTVSGKYCVAWLDLGGPVSIAAGSDLVVKPSSGGAFKLICG